VFLYRFCTGAHSPPRREPAELIELARRSLWGMDSKFGVCRWLSSSDYAAMRKVLEETEREQIVRALEQADWVISGPSGAAAKLGMKRSTLQARMQKLGIQITRTGANRSA
jgi:transcriptional regulator with GAF, ATPase, and Fis domain